MINFPIFFLNIFHFTRIRIHIKVFLIRFYAFLYLGEGLEREGQVPLQDEDDGEDIDFIPKLL